LRSNPETPGFLYITYSGENTFGGDGDDNGCCCGGNGGCCGSGCCCCDCCGHAAR
jgi:hypothetical protein